MVGHILPQEQHATLGVDKRLRIVSLLPMPAVPGFHDPAFAFGNVEWRLIEWVLGRRLRIPPSFIDDKALDIQGFDGIVKIPIFNPTGC